MYDILLKDCSVLRPDLTGADAHQVVGVSDGRIALVAAVDDPRARGAEAVEVIDCAHRLVMPGLVDCHTHTGQQLLRGRVLDSLPMIWTRVMLPFESTLTPELMELSAELAALEMIKSGTCAFVDAGSYFMDSAARVFASSGLRGLLSCSTMDQPGLPASIAMTAEEAVEATDALFDEYDGEGLLRVAYSLRALMSCSSELVGLVRDHARERGARVQAHMNEYAAEVTYTLQRFGVRPFAYLDSLGVLAPDFLAAHCIMLSEAEKDLVARRGVKVCHCPFSNCAKGVPAVPSLLDRGIDVGLGTDGAAHGGLSLWAEMRLLRSVVNVTQGVEVADPAVLPAAELVRMATEGGYRFLGEPDAGRVEEGAVADLITLDLRNPFMHPTGNVVNSLVECAGPEQVRDMVVGGRLVMREREVITLDEEAIMARADAYVSERGLA